MSSIYEVIERSNYPSEQLEGYVYNPVIGKTSVWTPVGDRLSANEKSAPSTVPADKYFTLRLDGKNFSTVVPKLKRLGLFSQGYSVEFEEIMTQVSQFCTTRLFKGVLYVFSQSDEITVLFDRVNPDLEQQSHEFGGRKDKLLSLSASMVSTEFVRLLCLKAVEKGLIEQVLPELPVIAFDSRLGVYDSLQEAFELILWRSYDCSVNGISQAIYQCSLPNSKVVNGRNTTEKLNFLQENSLLPLRDHQAYGTLLKKERRLVATVNRMTGESTEVERNVFVKIDGPVIRNVKENLLVV